MASVPAVSNFMDITRELSEVIKAYFAPFGEAKAMINYRRTTCRAYIILSIDRGRQYQHVGTADEWFVALIEAISTPSSTATVQDQTQHTDPYNDTVILGFTYNIHDVPLFLETLKKRTYEQYNKAFSALIENELTQ